MNRWVVCTSALVVMAMLGGCGSGDHTTGDYAMLVNASGSTGMKGNGKFAAGSNKHPGYVEMPVEVGAAGSLAPATGNHAPVTDFYASSRGLGIANDTGGIGIGIH